MIRLHFIKTGLFSLLACLALPSVAQLNAIAGYDISYLDVPRTNRLLEAFNDLHPEGFRHFNSLTTLHALLAGLRYNYDQGALELSFKKGLSRLGADNFSVQGITTDLDVHQNVETISLLSEWGKGLTFGASLQFNRFKHRLNYLDGGTDIKDFRSTQNRWGSMVFVGAHLASSSSISFSFRPYFQWFWKDVNLHSFANELGVGGDDCTDCTERPYAIGIAIIINNGAQ